MDLNDVPDAQPIMSETIVIKPENQADITKSNGSRNIRFLLPEYVEYFLPSQSNFSLDIKMSGRGEPIPSRDAAIHSLIQVVRSHNGAGSSLLESVEQYNTLVAQLYNYSKNDANANHRAEFEGLQANESWDENLYWSQGGTNWTTQTQADAMRNPAVARTVQIVTPLRTKLYDNDRYIPLAPLGGIRLELQLEDWRRALEYTTGSLAIGSDNGMPLDPVMLIIDTSGVQPAVGGEAAVDVFNYTGGGCTPGKGYVAGNIYSYTVAGEVDPGGFVQVYAVDVSGEIVSANIYALGTNTGTEPAVIPTPGVKITLDTQAAPSASYVAAVLEVKPDVWSIGDGAIGNPYQDIYAPLWALNAAELAAFVVSQGYVASPLDLKTKGYFGHNTAVSPDRRVTPQASAAYGATKCFPNTVMPFSIGDRVYFRNLLEADQHTLGVCSGFCHYETAAGVESQTPMMFMRPEITPVPALISRAAHAGKAADEYIFTKNHGYSHNLGGVKLYMENADRERGFTPDFAAFDRSNALLLTEARDNIADFNIHNIQYQMKRVEVPPQLLMADMAAAQSQAGLLLDLETVETRQVNLAAIGGPTSQLVSIPNITRALGILSVPLVQSEQRGLQFKSLRGLADNMSNYQLDLGELGLTPNRPVPTEMSSNADPKLQTQFVNEKIKGMESFGVTTNNLADQLNFSVAREFARPGQYMDLMALGDLRLNSQFDVPQTEAKLYIHFINHLRSINITGNGTQIAN